MRRCCAGSPPSGPHRASVPAADRRDGGGGGASTYQPIYAPTSTHSSSPLSDRELDVLRLLASDLDGPAIARELVVSLNTVRTHTKHIYAKLGVNSRRAAVGGPPAQLLSRQLAALTGPRSGGRRAPRITTSGSSPHDVTTAHHLRS